MNLSLPSRQTLYNALCIAAGNILYSLTVAAFLMPAGLVTGGATGIALAVNRLTGLSASGVLLAVNLAMLVLGWAVMGRSFALNTLASSLISPVALELWQQLLAGRVLTEDLLLCTVFSGLGIGVSLGLVLRAGASTGGMDIPPIVLQKLFRLPVSATMMAFDLLVLLAQAVSSPMDQVLYGIVMILIYTIVLDKVLLRGTSRTEVKIISPQSEAIREAILSQIDRGVTVLYGEGGYLRERSAVLLSVVSNRELPRVERVVRSIDPECFMVVSHVTEVSGRGFSLSKKYQ
ncbi:MAG: YitT family protein [Faecalibacterium sp.]